MTKDILKDKFLVPFLLILFFGFVSFKKINDWVFLLTFLLILLTILCLVYYFRNDCYIHNYSIENNSLRIQYQKNFFKNQVITFSTDLKSIESLKFHSRSFLDTFHVISFKYIDKEGLYEKKTFKINNDKTFVELIYKLKTN